MYKYVSSETGELAHQLTLSPARLRLSQLEGIEKLLGMVKPEASYPYELVCFHITGYRPRGNQPRPAIAGRKLIPDLVVMAEQISRKANIPVTALTEKYVLQEELGLQLGVSTKTIRRWRSRGLMGVRALFADGASRQVFLDGTVKRLLTTRSNGAITVASQGQGYFQITVNQR